MDRTQLHLGRAGRQKVAVGCQPLVVGCLAGWLMALAGSELRWLLLLSLHSDSHSLWVGLLPPQAGQETSGWLEAQPPAGKLLAGPLDGLRPSGWDGARRGECEQSSGEAGCAPEVAAACEVQPSLFLAVAQLQQLPQA